MPSSKMWSRASGFNGGACSYRLLTNLGYNVSGFNVNLRWRHLPSAIQAGNASTQAIIANDERVVASGQGVLLSYAPSLTRSVAAYDTFDRSATWTVNAMVSLRAESTICSTSNRFPRRFRTDSRRARI